MVGELRIQKENKKHGWQLLLSSPTIVSAVGLTFILAVLFRQESATMKSKAKLAKVMGTVVCISGTMILAFYHGKIIDIGDDRNMDYSKESAEN